LSIGLKLGKKKSRRLSPRLVSNIVRNVVERLKMKQGCSLLKEGKAEKEVMLQIIEADFDSLLEDDDLRFYLHEKRKMTIGFS